MRPDLLPLVHLSLRVKECNVGDSVSLCRAGREEWRYHSAISLSVGWILIVERLVEHGSLGHAVKVIRQEHRISFGSDALAEAAYHRTQAQRIRPNQHSGMSTLRRVNKDRVAGAVRRFDLNVGLDDRQFFARC